jgi:hypothetical protein
MPVHWHGPECTVLGQMSSHARAKLGGASLSLPSRVWPSFLAQFGTKMDEDASLEALAGLLETLAANPYDINAHAQHLALAKASGMSDQAQTARDMLVGFWAAGEAVWTESLEEKAREVDLETEAGVKALLEVYERAEADYLCASTKHTSPYAC